MFDKLKNSFDKGIATVSVKSESMVETSKIKSTISNLQKTLADCTQNLGVLVFTAWKENRMDDPAIIELCQQMQEIEKNITQQRARLDQVKREETEILGTNKPTACYCSSCGKPNSAQARFCAACGEPLNR